MREGVYRAQFSTPLGSGCGVVTAANGAISGGDSRSYYLGDYTLTGDYVAVQLDVNRHTRLLFAPSILGSRKATVQIDGYFRGDTAELSGFAVGKGLQPIKITIERIAAPSQSDAS